MSDLPLAVIDVGSNSGRLVVVEPHGGGLSVLADARAPLRLAEDLESGVLTPQAIKRTVAAMVDFAAIAQAYGAARTVAVATSAVRESSNAAEMIEAIAAATGISVAVISGDDEATCAFAGAIHSLDVESGMVLDIGGGSAELIRFKDRAQVESWTLPLGSLRLARRFVTAAPAVASEVRDLRKHVSSVLSDAGVRPIATGETVVGTGGTLRTLGKVHRRAQGSPVLRIHGQVVPRMVADEIASRLSGLSAGRITDVPGISEDRTDSIVAGSVIASELLRRLEAEAVVVSGHGLREGLAYRALGITPAPPADIRAAAAAALTERFAGGRASLASARSAVASRLLDVVLPVASSTLREMIAHAATMLDIGEAIDHFNRAEVTADIVLRADLPGFSHEQRALVAVLVMGAHRPKSGSKTMRRLLTRSDQQLAPGASAVLSLADEIVRRLPADDRDEVKVAGDGQAVTVRASVPEGRWTAVAAERLLETTRCRLTVERPDQR